MRLAVVTESVFLNNECVSHKSVMLTFVMIVRNAAWSVPSLCHYLHNLLVSHWIGKEVQVSQGNYQFVIYVKQKEGVRWEWA